MGDDRGVKLQALWIAAMSVALFAWLAHAVAWGPADRFDLAVRGTIHTWASPQLTFAMRGITLLASPAFLLPFGALIVWQLMATGRRGAATLLLIAALGGEALDQGLKLFFARPRPEAFFGLPEPETYSFPSGHSMGSCCFYGALAIIAMAGAQSRRARWAIAAGAVALIALVGLSRIYLGVHYPTDVLGGYLAGLAWLAVIEGVRMRPDVRSPRTRR
jgi:undecaprenyl-diphosphatase